MIHTNVKWPLIQSQTDETEYDLLRPGEIASFAHSSSFYPLAEIPIGETKYRLLSSIDAMVNYNSSKERWECKTRALNYMGISSESREAAIEDFYSQLHIRFQQLYSMRTFEMTEQEYNEWIKLANTIDLLDYKTTTPIKTKEIGCISYGRVSYPYRIKWLTGENYKIEPSKVPAELMSYKTGQWIEAIVERDPINHSVLSICSVRKIKFYIPGTGEVKKYWDDMQTIESDNQND